MTNQQNNEAYKCVSLLNKCRECLDNAMYRMDYTEVDDPDYQKYRKIYDDYICKALDQF